MNQQELDEWYDNELKNIEESLIIKFSEKKNKNKAEEEFHIKIKKIHEHYERESEKNLKDEKLRSAIKQRFKKINDIITRLTDQFQ